MTYRPIVAIPDPILRRKAHKVTTFDRDLQTLIDDMIETMRVAPGVGLAAPQVDVSLRVIVVEYGDEDEEHPSPKKLYALVNPEISSHSAETVTGVEGCLSIPNLEGEVERYEKVVVKALDRHGHAVKIRADGWLARIFQHEIDHLDGVLYTDRATRVWMPAEQTEEAVPEV
jgi:peptide deformylase